MCHIMGLNTPMRSVCKAEPGASLVRLRNYEPIISDLSHEEGLIPGKWHFVIGSCSCITKLANRQNQEQIIRNRRPHGILIETRTADPI